MQIVILMLMMHTRTYVCVYIYIYIYIYPPRGPHSPGGARDALPADGLGAAQQEGPNNNKLSG